MEYNSGYMVKEIRIKLGLKQKDIACEGVSRSFISYLENGQRTLDMELSKKISKQMNLKIKQKNIKVGFEITPELILGRKDGDIERLVNNLKNATQYCYIEIDRYLESCTCELGEKLINKMHDDIFKYNFPIYRDDIIKYFNILIKFTTDKEEIAIKKVAIIKAKLFSDEENRYKDIIEIADTIGSDINLCDEITKISYYHNVADAYRKLGKLNKAFEFINKIKNIKGSSFEAKILNTKANICVELKKYGKAENLYKRIIEISKSENEIANAYSNLAYVYSLIRDLDKANYYISKAFEFIDSINDYHKYNLYYVKLQIDISKTSEVLETIKQTLLYAKLLDNTAKINEILEISINYYKNDRTALIEIVKSLHDLQIKTDSFILIDILPLLVNDSLCKVLKEIPHY